MYKIKVPERRIVEEQLDTLRARIQDQVKSFHSNGGHKTLSKVLETNYLTLNVQVEPGGLTEWFLNKLENKYYFPSPKGHATIHKPHAFFLPCFSI